MATDHAHLSLPDDASDDSGNGVCGRRRREGRVAHHNARESGAWDAATAATVAAALVAMAAVEYTVFGSRAVPANEPLKLWHSGWGSQHVADAYSLTHLNHGVLAFFIWKNLLARVWSPRVAVIVTTAAEIAWELWEASPGAKDSYGEIYNYKGDTVVNSVADVLFMLAGLTAAMRLGTNKAAAALWVAIDATTLHMVADTFVLNHLWAMLPREVLHHYLGPVAAWQERTWAIIGE